MCPFCKLSKVIHELPRKLRRRRIYNRMMKAESIIAKQSFPIAVTARVANIKEFK